jgi:uncharacterized protein (DUF433 family)
MPQGPRIERLLQPDREISTDEILKAYPCLEADDIREAPAYAAWRAEEQEVPLVQP